jgi:hypothetical protein
MAVDGSPAAARLPFQDMVIIFKQSAANELRNSRRRTQVPFRRSFDISVQTLLSNHRTERTATGFM